MKKNSMKKARLFVARAGENSYMRNTRLVWVVSKINTTKEGIIMRL
jgi:hypothetical protein